MEQKISPQKALLLGHVLLVKKGHWKRDCPCLQRDRRSGTHFPTWHPLPHLRVGTGGSGILGSWGWSVSFDIKMTEPQVTLDVGGKVIIFLLMQEPLTLSLFSIPGPTCFSYHKTVDIEWETKMCHQTMAFNLQIQMSVCYSVFLVHPSCLIPLLGWDLMYKLGSRFALVRGRSRLHCRVPDVGLDPGIPGSRPGPKAGAKRLSHPGVPKQPFRHQICSAWGIGGNII